MSQDEQGYQRGYDFGRGRTSQEYGYQPREQHAQMDHTSQYYGRPPGGHGQAAPPPPPGHRGRFTLVALYVVGLFMLLWTAASVAGMIDALGGPDDDQAIIGVVMTAASVLIAAGLGSWIIRIHRRRAAYQRILDHHYAQRYGHHPDQI